MFQTLIWLVFAVICASMLYAYIRTRDNFHPLFVLGPMLGYLYWYLPLDLNASGRLSTFFNGDELVLVQLVNFFAILGFCLGCLFVTDRTRWTSWVRVLRHDECNQKVVWHGALMNGVLGMGAWIATVLTVGGFG